MGYTMRDRTDAVKLAHKIGVQEAAQELGIPSPTLYRWGGNVAILKAAGLLDLVSTATQDYPDDPDDLLDRLQLHADEQQRIIAKLRKIIGSEKGRGTTKPSKKNSKNWIDAVLRDVT